MIIKIVTELTIKNKGHEVTYMYHCCYLRASVGIGMAILPMEGIYPQIKMPKVLFKTKTNNLPLICSKLEGNVIKI